MTCGVSISAGRRCALRLLMIVLVLAGLSVGLPGASGASGSAPPASVSFDPELLGSWAAVGNTLDVDPGAWTGAPSSIAAQWYRCDSAGSVCAPIDGATSLSYTLAAADAGQTVFAAVTATNGFGTGSAATYLSGVVGAPTVVGEPVISGDANVDGTTLSVSQGSWTSSPTAYAYQWSSCNGSTFVCTPIPGATGSTYLVSTSALNGDYLTVDVTASNAAGSADNVAHPPFAVGTAHTDVISTGGISGVPVAVVYPSWFGDASKVGNVLVGDLGVWTNHPTSLSYGWYRCTVACSPIPGASSLTYTVQAADAGNLIEFAADAFNGAGQSARYGFYGYLENNTYVSTSGPAGAPEPLLPPQLTGDATGAGSLIQVTPVEWSAPQDANVTVTYQWVRCDASGANCAAIGGATSSSYALTGADLGQTIYVVVDGQNSFGTTSLTSTTLTPPIGAPVGSVDPAIGGDTSGAGNTVTVSNGTWVNDPTSFQYQWYACDANGANCAVIAGATAATYQTTAGNVGGTLIAEVDATNADGTATAFSQPSDLIGAPFATVAPVLSSSDTLAGGTPVAELGDTLSVDQGTWNGAPTSITYQWFRCDPSAPTKSDFTNCSAIGGATSSSYLTVSADLGHTVFVEIDATNGTGTTVAYANPRGSVGVPQPLLDDGSLGGTPQVGQTLTFVNGSSWEGDTPITWRYLWRRCDSSGNNCVTIPGATAGTYTLVPADQGAVIQGVITGSNTWGGNGWGLAYDSAVVTGASGSGGGGGGGGGGSGSVPNLKVIWSQATTLTPAPGSEDDFSVTVSNMGSAGSLQTQLVISLPATLTLLGPPAYTVGSGCTGTQTLDCFLDYLPNGSSTTIRFSVRVTGSGAQTLTATVSSDREADPSDNTAVESLQVGTPQPPAPPPAPPTVPPVRKHVINGNNKPNHLTGTKGADVIHAGGGNDWVNGGAGNDAIYGGAGNDILFGGPGADVIFGGVGNDVIHVRDGVKDTVDCGPGRDTVFADKTDKVARNCEIVRRG